MEKIERKKVSNGNGLEMSYLERKGDGVLVVLLHGFPELADSWANQISYLGDRGFWVVAPDQRGYGETTGWDENDVESFSAMNLARDVVGLILAIGGKRAILVGHDFGTTPAFYTSLLRPDLIDGLCCMAIPLCSAPPKMIPNASQAVVRGFEKLESLGHTHYQSYICSDGIKECIDGDLERWLRVMYFHASGLSTSADGFNPQKGRFFPMAVKKGVSYYEQLPDKGKDTPLLSFLDIEKHAAAFAKTGMKGPINWYRNLNKNVDDLQFFAGLSLSMPYQFLAGERDFCVPMYKDLYARIPSLPNLHSCHLIKGSGHWVQQENPKMTNQHLLPFLNFCEMRSSGKL
eukprot:TRINITY_DN4250_c1_g1_i1.p1 TRINITY_DN4250_c1_g1~~TRINITY_DN4250_c1_g1_i1.p1  ORF type:complete len:353 (+),score=43.22 TRINITY_DN4250_c1_g1_i1:23-1060(+)